MSELHTITVQYQFDSECPVMSTTVKYRVLSEELETEIIFPNGTEKIFKNWDVRGVRERSFREDVLQEGVPADMVDWVDGGEAGVRPSDVQRFCADLAKRSVYESWFESEFSQIMEILAESAVIPKEIAAIVEVKSEPKPESKATVSAPVQGGKGRKFPYDEVAKLWAEGKTLREIATTIGYLKPGKDCTHAVRTFLTKMHAGYIDGNGNKAVLPYRDRSRTKKAAAHA